MEKEDLEIRKASEELTAEDLEKVNGGESVSCCECLKNCDCPKNCSCD